MMAGWLAGWLAVQAYKHVTILTYNGNIIENACKDMP
jgi:hypothetical protein